MSKLVCPLHCIGFVVFLSNLFSGLWISVGVCDSMYTAAAQLAKRSGAPLVLVCSLFCESNQIRCYANAILQEW